MTAQTNSPEHFSWDGQCMTPYVVTYLDSTITKDSLHNEIVKWARIVTPTPSLDIVAISDNYIRIQTLTRGPYAINVFGKVPVATRWELEIESRDGRYLFRILELSYLVSDDDGDWRNGGGFVTLYSLKDGWGDLCDKFNKDGSARDRRLKYVNEIAEYFELLNEDLKGFISQKDRTANSFAW